MKVCSLACFACMLNAFIACKVLVLALKLKLDAKLHTKSLTWVKICIMWVQKPAGNRRNKKEPQFSVKTKIPPLNYVKGV